MLLHLLLQLLRMLLRRLCMLLHILEEMFRVLHGNDYYSLDTVQDFVCEFGINESC